MRIALLAAAAALVSVSFAHAQTFNPQPDPPGKTTVHAFNPQPDPPVARHDDMSHGTICHDDRGKVIKCAPAPAPCHDAQGRTLACAHKPG